VCKSFDQETDKSIRILTKNEVHLIFDGAVRDLCVFTVILPNVSVNPVKCKIA
jgi:hypothetical protein